MEEKSLNLNKTKEKIEIAFSFYLLGRLFFAFCSFLYFFKGFFFLFFFLFHYKKFFSHRFPLKVTFKLVMNLARI